MSNRQNKAAAKPRSRKKVAASPESRAVELQARADLEQQRHRQLCQLLEHSVPNHCDDYLRQLATTAVQVRTMAEIATLQAQLLQVQQAMNEAARPETPVADTPSAFSSVQEHLSSLFRNM